MEFKIQDFAKYLINDKAYLKTLKLDGENSNNIQLLNIIPNLENLKELNISYCENRRFFFRYDIINSQSIY